jgi:hypothetical protein
MKWHEHQKFQFWHQSKRGICMVTVSDCHLLFQIWKMHLHIWIGHSLGQEWLTMVVGGLNSSLAPMEAECMRLKALKVLSRENDLHCYKSRYNTLLTL